jgi:hypothetical protein
MPHSLMLSLLIIFAAQLASPSSTPMQYGRLIHDGTSVTIQTNDARPLDQAVVASRREYGWLVDYEDPLYTRDDLIDARTPDFLQLHPNAKLLLRPKGGEFSHKFKVDPATNPSSDIVRKNFMSELVDAYGKSNNPGAFEVSESGPHRLVVVGRNPNSVSVLDYNVSISLNSETGLASLEEILHSISPAAGHKVGLGFVTPGPLMRCVVTKTYSNVSARSALLDVLDTCHQTVVYEFLFDANRDTYLFNLDGVVTTVTDAAGRRWLKPVQSQH